MVALLLTAFSPALLPGLKPVTMKHRKLGSSDMMVSSCCLGTMTWGCQNTDEEAAAQMNCAWDMGVNFLDTAEIYPVPVEEAKQGATDRAIAKWLKTNNRARDEVIIASKVAGFNERFTWMRDGPTRVTRDQIISSVDASLARLGVEHLDLLQIHWPDRYVPMFGSVAYDCSKERDDAVSFEEQVISRISPRAPHDLPTISPRSPPRAHHELPTISTVPLEEEARAMGEALMASVGF